MLSRLKSLAIIFFIAGLTIILLAGCSQAPIVEPEAPIITIPADQPTEKPDVTVGVSESRPANVVVMQRGMGYHWHRKPPEKKWELLSVVFDVRNFKVEPVTLDRAIVEIAGQWEEVKIELGLEGFNDCIIHVIPIRTIKDIPSGEYELTVSLWSGDEMMCSRTDIAKAYWKEKSEATKVYIAE